MSRFSAEQKYQICRAALYALLIIGVACLTQLSPHSAGGNNTKFVLLLFVVVLAMPLGIGFYYYRTKRHDIEDIAIQTLVAFDRNDRDKEQ